jgi:hypothetical protein
MAGYQTPYDAQSYVTNPYQLPTQQIIGAVQTRNQYWEGAASNLRNAYQNYLGLDLSRADNHERLNQLMQGVNENLQRVVKTDLSLGENYGEAMKVFDPITHDDNIMGDNAITRHYKQEFATAQSYRTKDNGKEYSETNVRDLSNHLQDFVNDSSAANWRSHYSTRAFYTPYTDVAAEIRTLERSFKPDTMSLTTPMYLDANGKPTDRGGNPSGYMLNKTDKSIIASQYRAYMDAHLSDKAKNQLAIDGRVRYHDNPNALISDYANHNQERIDAYNSRLRELQGALNGATDAQKEDINTQINNYKGLLDDATRENTKIKAGDYSNILPYKNQIAASIYSSNYMDYLSKASAQKNIDIKYTPDQVWKTMYQEANENNRFNIASDLKWKIANLNNDTKLQIAGLKGLNGQPLLGIPGYKTADNFNDEEFGVSKYNELRSSSEKDWQGAVDNLNKQIKDARGVDVTDTSIPKETRDAATQAFWADPRSKAALDQYKQSAAKKSAEDQMFAGIDNYVNGQLAQKYPEIYKGRENIINNIKSGGSLSLREFNQTGDIYSGISPTKFNFNLTADDIKRILNGTHPTMSLGTEKTIRDVSGTPTTVESQVIRYQGKNYDFSSQTLQGALNDISKVTGDFESKRADILKQNITRIAGIENLFQNDKNPYYNAAHQITLRAIAGSDYVVKPEDVLLSAKDASGGIYFKVQGDAHVNIDKIKDRVKAEGGRYIKADDTFFLPGDKYGQLTQAQSFQDVKLSPIKRLVDFRSTATPNDIFDTAPAQWGNRNFQFKVNIQNGHPSYTIVDPYSGAMFGSDMNGAPFNTLESAAQIATTLGNLSQQDFLNLIRTTGGVPDYKTK